MDFQGLGKIILIAGVLLSVIGILLVLSPKIPFIGKLPGDFYFRKGNSTFYFPLATSIVISIVLSLILGFVLRGK